MDFIKEKYIPLNIIDTQEYIKVIKDTFERELAKFLNLKRISAPIFVTSDSGLQDNLSGVERRVAFDIKKDNKTLEIVQSLAKWKRFALHKYEFSVHSGLYTDMTAIRRDEMIDEIHSIYVDQWDWEKVIERNDRNLDYLYETVSNICKAIKSTSKKLKKVSKINLPIIKEKCFFITSQELLNLYPNKTPKEREYLITKKHKTVFISQIGHDLSNGLPHDLRAPDYDDWTLNGDLFFYDEVLDIALELSSMGIRVDSAKMQEQLKLSKKEERLSFQFHKDIISNKLPLSIGGGIGQSRLCLLLLGRAHIGEVQASYWDEETIKQCNERNINLL